MRVLLEIRRNIGLKEVNLDIETCRRDYMDGVHDVVKSTHLGVLIEPKSKPSASKVTQHNTYVGLQFNHEYFFSSSHLKRVLSGVI